MRTPPRSRVDRANERWRIAQDPVLMREMLERHFQPPEAPRFRVQECRIEYLRGGDGPRVAVQYNLQLEDIATGRVYEQVVSGLGYGPGRTRGALESLGRPEALPAVMGLPSYSYLAELDLLIQVFPFDYRMPALASVMAGPPPEILPPILATFGGGAWQVEVWEPEPVRYRVDQRATLQLRLLARDEETGRLEERRFYLKLYRDRAKGQRAFASQHTLFEAVAAAGTPFEVAAPVVYADDLSLLVQCGLQGTSLQTILQLQGVAALPKVRAAARAVAALHQLPLKTAPEAPSDAVARLQRGLERIRLSRPDLALIVESLIEAMEIGFEGEPRPIRGDLTLDHILLDGGRVGLIDFDLLLAGDPLRDLASFAGYLAKTRSRVKKERDQAGAALHAFLDEYFAHVPEQWRARLP